MSVVWFICVTIRDEADTSCCSLPSFLASSQTALFLSLQRCVMRPSPQHQQKRQSTLRLKWECWTEAGGLTLSFRKNPLKASTNTCLPSSLICVTGESLLMLNHHFSATVCKYKNDLWGVFYLKLCCRITVLESWLIADYITVAWRIYLMEWLTCVFLCGGFSCFWTSGFRLCFMTAFFSLYVNAVSV